MEEGFGVPGDRLDPGGWLLSAATRDSGKDPADFPEQFVLWKR